MYFPKGAVADLLNKIPLSLVEERLRSGYYEKRETPQSGLDF